MLLAFFRSFSLSLISLGLPNYLIFDLKANNFIAGASNTMYCIPYALFPPIAAKISDKIKRKNAIIIGVGGAIFVYFGFILEIGIYWLLLLRFLEGFFTCFFWPILQAIISDVSKIDQNHNSRIFKFNFSWNGGSIFGFLTGGIAVFILNNNYIVFNICFISSFLMIIPLIFLKIPNKKSISNFIKSNPSKNINFQNSQINLATFSIFIPIILILIYSITYGTINILVSAKYEFLGYSAYLTYILVFARTSIATLSSFIASKYKIQNLKLVFTISAGYFIIFNIIFAFTTEFYIYLLIYLIMGFFGINLYTISLKFFLEKNSYKETAFYTGLFEAIIGIGFGIGPIIAGFSDIFDVDHIFILISIINIVFLIISILIWNKYFKS